ncbi:MAG: D-alanyl-D-alanine carboxypeptidase family protein, partial [Ruminococcus sp.]|nr:D-alanyl-D-alanine carboxypeptidase family protein [Ruminococcus sp.]
LCTLSACGKNDSTDDSIVVKKGSFNIVTENTSDGEVQDDITKGYIVTVSATTISTVAESGNTISETITAVPETPAETPASEAGYTAELPETEVPETESPEIYSEIPETEIPSEYEIPETTEESAPSVIDYTPSTATAGTPASTAVLPADAPKESDYNYGPAPVVYDIAGIKYIDNVLIANKSYSLPADFYPELDQTCLNQFYKLQNDASAVGLNIYLSSGFRSYYTQDTIYNNYVAMDGQEMADTYSARPGHSEHQSGLAIDVNQIDDTFIGTPEAIWLEQHCYEYGFILRYPQSKQDITGYKYESWHIRYVGTDMSYKIHAKALEMGDPYLTLEEYFGIDSYYH